MLKIIRTLHGILSVILIILNTIFWCVPLAVLALLKFSIPIRPLRFILTKIINFIAISWTSVNNFNINLTKNIDIEISNLTDLDSKKTYMLISNHQSWTDIIILQKIFNRKIPFFRFFLKRNLIYIPFLGISWWALDYPFMNRYKESYLQKHPELKKRNIENTKKACLKYRKMPVTITNFLEGTRFTEEKHASQNSPFKNLLKPKAGGIAFALEVIGDQIEKLIDVTIVYPDGKADFWKFLCGELNRIRIDINIIPGEEIPAGSYSSDGEFRKNFQQWINTLWIRKDRIISKLKFQ
ncbi:MAG: acyltransferase [Spirochaetes bacterium]|nr:acyltransferase [Spirochaetota bacterium]